VIVCEGLTYAAGGFTLGPIDIEIAPGISVFLGPNGAGKSSLLSLIAGLVRPKSGRITIEGHDPFLVSAHARAALAAVAPQNTPPVYGMKTADFIATGGFRKTRRIYSDPELLRSLHEILGLTMLAAQEKQDFASLSGGEQRRALLARALLQDAAWTLLDEPTSFLDYAHNQILYALLHTLKAEGRNLILVTHDADFAARIADHIVFLRQGRVHRSGSGSLASCPEILEEVFAASFTNANGRILPSYTPQ